MPPVLDPTKSEVDGLAFVGLSLQRKSDRGHPSSKTHQTAFDLNQVQDREYQFLFSSNDDGWLVGGGEPGPPKSYKLAAADSAHVEIMRLGTYQTQWGGLPVEAVVEAVQTGDILIPHIEVVPTAVVANGDIPPELEIRFDMEPPVPPDENDTTTPLPVNWQLRFLHNQLFERFEFPSRFCPGAFHSTILRKAEFRSEEHRKNYFAKCQTAVEQWQRQGPKPLIPVDDGLANKRSSSSSHRVKQIKCTKGTPRRLQLEQQQQQQHTKKPEPAWSKEYQSGIWLFTDRNNITHRFMPNFLPPYDTPVKRKLILRVLNRHWDERSLQWKPAAVVAASPPLQLHPQSEQDETNKEHNHDDDCNKSKEIPPTQPCAAVPLPPQLHPPPVIGEQAPLVTTAAPTVEEKKEVDPAVLVAEHLISKGGSSSSFGCGAEPSVNDISQEIRKKKTAAVATTAAAAAVATTTPTKPEEVHTSEDVHTSGDATKSTTRSKAAVVTDDSDAVPKTDDTSKHFMSAICCGVEYGII